MSKAARNYKDIFKNISKYLVIILMEYFLLFISSERLVSSCRFQRNKLKDKILDMSPY